MNYIRRTFPASLVIATFLVVPLAHFLWFLAKWHQFSQFTTGDILEIGNVHHRGNNTFHLRGVIGDVLDPKGRDEGRNDKSIQFDLVPVTAIIDPIDLTDYRTISWNRSFLLQSALEQTFPYPDVYEEAVQNLVSSMGQHGHLVSFFLYEMGRSHTFNPTEGPMRFANQTFIWDVPENEDFRNKTGIEKFAVLPIFDSEAATTELSPRVLRKRLAANLRIVVDRLARDLEGTSIKSVGFAALAASSRRPDSHLYLTYHESFSAIYEALRDSRVPDSISEVYFVVYEGLGLSELRDARAGLFRLYARLALLEWWWSLPPFLNVLPLSGVYGVLFAVQMLWTHPKRHTVTAPKARREFWNQVIGFSGAATLTATAFFSLFFLVAETSISALFVTELLISVLLAIVVLHINNLPPFRKTK